MDAVGCVLEGLSVKPTFGSDPTLVGATVCQTGRGPGVCSDSWHIRGVFRAERPLAFHRCA